MKELLDLFFLMVAVCGGYLIGSARSAHREREPERMVRRWRENLEKIIHDNHRN